MNLAPCAVAAIRRSLNCELNSFNWPLFLMASRYSSILGRGLLRPRDRNVVRRQHRPLICRRRASLTISRACA